MLETPTTDVLTTVITAIGGLVGISLTFIAPVIVKHWLDKRAARAAATDDDYEIRYTIPEMQGLILRIDNLILKTKVDRFLLLKAENGATPMKTATALIERYRDKQDFYAVLLYDHVEIDEHYREMLKITEAQGFCDLETKKMPKGARLRGFYEDEEVTFSKCYFLMRMSLADGKTVIFYATIATKQTTDYTDREQREIERVVEYMKKILKSEMERMLLINKGATK